MTRPILFYPLLGIEEDIAAFMVKVAPRPLRLTEGKFLLTQAVLRLGIITEAMEDFLLI